MNLELSRLADELDICNAAEVEAWARNALLAHGHTRNIAIQRTAQLARDNQRVRIVIGREKEARTAHDNREWFDKHFQGGRLQRD
jgi:hypothetical protein